MNKLLAGGKRALARIIAGQGTPINGMYIIYSTEDISAAPDVSLEYLTRLSETGGFARVPITSATVNADGSVSFSAMLTSQDAKGKAVTKQSKIRAAVLACMPDDTMVNDTFVYSTVMTSPVQLVKGAYMTVNVKMIIGE